MEKREGSEGETNGEKRGGEWSGGRKREGGREGEGVKWREGVEWRGGRGGEGTTDSIPVGRVSYRLDIGPAGLLISANSIPATNPS